MADFSFAGKKVIVFDLDGTIINLTADWKALKDILVEKYIEIYKEHCDVERVSNCLDKIVEKNDEITLENFFDEIQQYEQKFLKDTKLIEETIFFIKNKDLFNVKNNVKFAILSLNTRNTIIQALELAKIYNKIDYIIGREDVRKWKPSPEGLLKIKNHFKVKKEEMVYFGDLKNDILTGQNAEIEAFLIDDLIDYIHLIKNNLNER